MTIQTTRALNKQDRSWQDGLLQQCNWALQKRSAHNLDVTLKVKHQDGDHWWHFGGNCRDSQGLRGMEQLCNKMLNCSMIAWPFMLKCWWEMRCLTYILSSISISVSEHWVWPLMGLCRNVTQQRKSRNKKNPPTFLWVQEHNFPLAATSSYHQQPATYTKLLFD